MKLKALRSKEAPLLETDCFSNNQNTNSTEPINFDQSGTILGGGAGISFTYPIIKYVCINSSTSVIY